MYTGFLVCSVPLAGQTEVGTFGETCSSYYGFYGRPSSCLPARLYQLYNNQQTSLTHTSTPTHTYTPHTHAPKNTHFETLMHDSDAKSC